MQSEGRWIVDSSAVKLVASDGGVATPTALEIYDCEFEGLREVSGVKVQRPSDDIDGLRFESTVAPIAPALRQHADGSIRLSLELATADRATIESWPESDQLIVADRWYALLPGSVDSRVVLESEGIQLGGPLNVKQVLWLLWHEELDVESFLPDGPLGGFHSAAGGPEFDPQLLKATLYHYQQEGAEFLSQLVEGGVGGLLADEMGLGKTMQAIYLLADAARRGAVPNLVVLPASLLANWSRELSKFAPWIVALEHSGSQRTGNPARLRDASVVLTTYETASRDRYMLEMVEWNLVVLDEAQAIKNPQTQRSKSVKSFGKKSGLAITGTPIENSLTDIWSLFEFLVPQYLGDFDTFQSSYPDEIGAATSLSRRVAPMVLRRRVESVATDLPDRIDVPSPVYLSDAIVAEYETVRLNEDLHPLARMTLLRQLCASPTFAGLPSIAHDFPKFERLLEIVDVVMAEGRKALVFASYKEAIDEIAAALARGYNEAFVATIDGRRAPDDRQRLIDEFTAFDGPGLLVMNPKAAGVGLNIQAANYVIHFTPEWNPATVAQASARAHRRGQERPVFIYYLYYEGTVERYMMGRLDEKRQLQTAGLSMVTEEPKLSELQEALRLSPRRPGGSD